MRPLDLTLGLIGPTKIMKVLPACVVIRTIIIEIEIIKLLVITIMVIIVIMIINNSNL